MASTALSTLGVVVPRLPRKGRTRRYCRRWAVPVSRDALLSLLGGDSLPSLEGLADLRPAIYRHIPGAPSDGYLEALRPGDLPPTTPNGSPRCVNDLSAHAAGVDLARSWLAPPPLHDHPLSGPRPSGAARRPSGRPLRRRHREGDPDRQRCRRPQRRSRRGARAVKSARA